ncbi:PglL family O-oligosaccharyltransferase [Chromobacterium alkanivorans]|uniref:PglL family O-oligosaccharyltransferase n=1 Tax=Chromobacterium alkanivorans TaxID=1071719 RepID=UPI002167C1CA|nr:Wzy polymerase domain-containing protein [Chromobacterium alkanivorans]MCS3805375.1 O-antigen ligase [Chromobacterium alkanivorans]MCS3819714.1 O-antigen ligase [Chromobacterium alkanivorans]
MGSIELPFLFLAMHMNNNRYAMAVLAFSISVPFFNAWRYASSPDWLTNASCVFFVGLFIFFASLGAKEKGIPPVCLFLALCGVFFSLNTNEDVPLTSMVFFLMLWLAFFLGRLDGVDKEKFLHLAAVLILISAIFQSLFGVVQALGGAALFKGMILVSPHDVMGNFGQRNQFAQFLCWGGVAASYLYSKKSLGISYFVPVVVVLAMCVAWSGARLPLVYMLGLIGLVFYWLRKGKGDDAVQRMCFSLILVVFVFMFFQVFNHDVLSILREIGLKVRVESGVDRWMDAGFGARRKIEWSKAWYIFMQNPLRGVGYGGYPWQSVWLEAHGGWPKVPESWLFVHSHNLIFQLLAETGVIGTLIVIFGLFFCLAPYFIYGNQSNHGLFLISIGMMLLVHSMFEYPLWYMPFFVMLIIVCALSPARKMELSVGDGVVTGFGILVGSLCVLYFLINLPVYFKLASLYVPIDDSRERVRRELQLVNMSRNVFWVQEVDLALVNYLRPGFSLKDQNDFLSGVVKSRPFPLALVKLSIVKAMNGDAEGSREMMVLAIANYPDYVPGFIRIVGSYPSPQLQPLKDMLQKALMVGIQENPATLEGKAAVVMSVSDPVWRRALF